MKHGATLLFSFILFIGDFLSLVAAFALAFIMRVRWDDRPLIEPLTAEGYIAVVAALLAFWIFVFAILGLYKPEVYENRFKEALMLLVGSFIGILFLIGAEYVLNRAIFPARLVTVYGFLFALLLSLLMRTVVRGVRRTLLKFNIGVINVLLVGSSGITDELVTRLSAKHSGYRVLGVVGKSPKDSLTSKSPRYFGSFSEALSHLKTSNINSIVHTELYTDHERNNEILTAAQEHHIAYRFVPGNDRLFVGNIDVSLFEDIPMVAVHQTALIGWGRIVKRIFDLILSGILILILLPIIACIYLGVKVVDFGPVFYKQKRLTRYNNAMSIYKFRTFKKKFNDMTIDEAFTSIGNKKLADAYLKGDDTIPITELLHPLGALLRKTSLDELPQLLNVLRGDISLVGPRPLVPRELNDHAQKSIILSVKPGLTGLAAISGRRNIPFEERRKLDTYYVQNWSFLMDVVIILKTIVVVIRRAFSGNVD